MNSLEALSKLPFSLDTLKSFANSLIDTAVDVCEVEEHRPTVIFASLSDDRQAVMAPMHPAQAGPFFRDVEGKTALMAVVRSVFDPTNAVHEAVQDKLGGHAPNVVVVIAEAWLSTGNSDDAAPGKYLAPSQDPQRQEALVLTLHTPQCSIPTMHLIEAVDGQRKVHRQEIADLSTVVESFSGRFALHDESGSQSVH